MRFDIYCDESYPDLLSSEKPQGKYMVIGSLWLKNSSRENFKSSIHALRDKFLIGGEFKWQKISPSRVDFYKELIDWFCNQGEELRFRCIAVEHEKVNLIHYHNDDQELGFYKFYYQMLHHWVMDFNEYNVFCDYKTNSQRDRLHVLRNCLQNSNLSSEIMSVQAIRSRESVLIQVADVLTGLTAACLNRTLKMGSAKCQVSEYLSEKLNRGIGHTPKSEQKFNVFVIDLGGGW